MITWNSSKGGDGVSGMTMARKVIIFRFEDDD